VAKVLFDGAVKVITVNYGEASIDVKQDIYSEWKNWIAISANANFEQAIRTVGGDETVESQYIAPYFFLLNGWKIRPYEGDHTLNINGNLYVDGGGSPFVHTVGNFNVLINLTLSNNAVVVETGGSSLLSDERNHLLAIPTQTLSADERQNLLMVSAVSMSSSGGLTTEEHDRLFTLPTQTLSADERQNLLMVSAVSVSSSGLTVDEHNRLFTLPTQTLSADERNKLMNLNLINDITSTLGLNSSATLDELVQNCPITPTLAEAVMFLLMTVKNKLTQSNTTSTIYNSLGVPVLSASVSDIDNIFTKGEYNDI